MQRAARALFLCGSLLFLLAACDAGVVESSAGNSVSTSTGGTTGGSGGSTNTGGYTRGGAPQTGTKNQVTATPSVAGTVSVAVGSSETISVTFTSSDGQSIRGLAISGTTLPADWSGIDSYSCTNVGASASCVVNLTYAPKAAASGSLSLNYIFIDNANDPETPGASLVIPYVATTSNNVIASLAPTGEVNAAPGGAAQSVSINFTTDDGNAATHLMVSSDLTALPAGWSSRLGTFACSIVSTGSGCQLPLTYAPAATGSGTLRLAYSYTDDTGAARTGSANVPYSASTNGNVVAIVAPTGQVNAIQKTGHQSVTISFNTVDGKRASNFQIISDLTMLPAGWTSSAKRLSCGTVSTGNGCQLSLIYAPSSLSRGALSLDYSYLDAGGMYSLGTVTVPYASTTNDNVTGAATPTGQINAIVGAGSQPVALTFTTDDGRPATAFQVTTDLTMLPAGWSTSVTPFTCGGLSSGTGCQLTLTYAPTAAGSGSLTLTYSYLNNAGQPKNGSLNIPYLATTDNNVVATPSQSSLAVQAGSSTPVTVTFTTDDGNVATGLSITSDLLSLPPGWSSSAPAFSCATLSVGNACQLSLTYAPPLPDAGTLNLSFSYTNNSAIPKTGTVSVMYTATP